MFIFSQCLPPQRWQPAVLWWKSCSFLSHQLHRSTKSFYWLSSFATRSQWKTNIHQITQERLQGLGQSDTLPLGTLSKLPYCTSSHSTCVLIYFFTKVDAKLNLSCIGVNCQSYSQQQFSTITTTLFKRKPHLLSQKNFKCFPNHLVHSAKLDNKAKKNLWTRVRCWAYLAAGIGNSWHYEGWDIEGLVYLLLIITIIQQYPNVPSVP